MQALVVQDQASEDRFLNSLTGATDDDVAVFADELVGLFPHRPEITDPIHTAKKARVEHRSLVIRRAVEIVLNNLLLRNIDSGKVVFRSA